MNSSKTHTQRPRESYTLVSYYIQDRYGIALSNARNMVRGLWRIPDDQQSFLWRYEILKWQKNYFLAQLDDCARITALNNRQFIVLFHRCNMHDIKQATELWLSFRVWQPELEQPSVVLVKPVGMNRGD